MSRIEPFTATYGVVHDVLLNAATGPVTAGDLRLLIGIAEHGGTIEGASQTHVGRLGSNATAIRRSALALAGAGLVTNTSRRGVGMRLALTGAGREIASEILAEIRRALVVAS